MFKTYAATWYGVKAERRSAAVARTSRKQQERVLEVGGEEHESSRWATPAAFGLAYMAALSVGQPGTRR